MEWTHRLVAGILLGATCVEVTVALLLGAYGGLGLADALSAVFGVAGVAWTLVGMFASGAGRVAPPLTTGPGSGLGGLGPQPSASSEIYISRAGADRVAKESIRRLAHGSPFMVPAVLYGITLLAVGLWLVP